jgi:tetratricopeptide (TPR) repeat protein
VGLLLGVTSLLTVPFLMDHFRPAKVEVDLGQLTFAKDVAPIVFEKCSKCHYPDQAAPFSLLTYDDVFRRARQIVDVTEKGIMPPWLPLEGHGDFVGTRRLTDRERQTIKQWVDQGAPCGDSSSIPSSPEVVDSWLASPPDLVVETPSYTLASQERDVFRNFVVSVPVDGPRWVESIEIRPTNPRVTHHARLGVDSSNESARRDAEDAEPGYAGMAWGQDPEGQLVIWAPGMAANPSTPGVAWRLYQRNTLVLHTHMQPSGKPEVVSFRVGIRFAKEAPAQRHVILRIGSCDIDIPAGDRSKVVEDRYQLPIDVDAYSIFPHAHSLCTEIQLVAELPDGSRNSLININKFDENLHDSYRYRSPVRLPRGTLLYSKFVYDNSDLNPRNRNNPARRVVYGSNSNDEMADIYLQVSAVDSGQHSMLMEDYKRYQLQSQAVGYQRSLELYPDDSWSLEGLATTSLFLGQPSKAILLLEKRLRVGPKAVFPIVSMGMARLASGDPSGAEKYFRQATELDGEYSLAWFGLAKALASQKKMESAEQTFRRSAELSPRESEARLALADLLIQRGALDEAKEVTSAARDNSPDMANVYLKLAEISAKQQRYDESLEYCEESRRLAPYTHPAKVLLAVFCFANGDQERGLKLVHEARDESPDHPMPHLILGQLARQQQELTNARECLERSASVPVPKNWPLSHQRRFGVLLHSERFQLAQSIQDIHLALDALAKWLKHDPTNSKLNEMYQKLLEEKAMPSN